MAPVQANFAPDLDKFRKSLKSQPLAASVDGLVWLLRRRQIKTPQQCAVAAAHILLQVVAKGRWKDVDELLALVQQTGRRLGEARPRELVIGNITKRVMSLIRDEAMEDRNADADDTSKAPSVADDTTAANTTSDSKPARFARQPTFPAMASHATAQSIFSGLSESLGGVGSADISLGGSPFRKASGTSTPLGHANSVANLQSLRIEVIDGIEEIMDEIAQADDQIAAVADVQIRPGDCVMVHRPSPTVEKFLVRAAAKRQFTVLVARAEGSEPGEPSAGTAAGAVPKADAPHAALRKKLASHNVPVVNLANKGVMAYFPLVTKVILDAKAVTASGAVVAEAGAGLVARAAREHGSPVIVLAGVYKLSPTELDRPEPVLEWADSAAQTEYSDGDLMTGIDIRLPITEYLEAEMVDVYITNLGPHSSDHLQSVINDHYKLEDRDVSIQ